MSIQLAFPFDGCVQRWRYRRALYRPAGEVIAPREYDVAPVAEGTAKAFVLDHHYSASYPAARRRYGLYRRGQLVGIAVFSHPCHDRVLLSVFPTGSALDSVELGRFVLLDEIPANGETWFLARCFAALRREGLAGVVSFSDPLGRTAIDGSTVFAGHLGIIYQAHNARYLGRGRRQLLRLLPDGRVFSRRAEQKILSRSRGWRYASEILQRQGADAPDEDVRAWLVHWRERLTRRVRHPGNHKYAWPLQRAATRLMPPGRAYPKSFDRAAP